MLIRPPIVAILGHVDHGKTTLLDAIRKSKIADKEQGGITQRIGAYEIKTGIKGYDTDTITFIDTPGHEAFSQLRARGAQVADIALLLIDAKDSIMPQTIESIFHIRSAKIPFIIVINKIDLPDANPEKIENDLLKHEVAVEGKGGHVPVVMLSAKTGKGIQELLESILLITSDLKLIYKPSNPLQAYIIETKKDRRGIVTSVIVKEGTLKVGDSVYANGKKIKIRSLTNDIGMAVTSITASTPAEVLGFDELPTVGSFISSQELQKTDLSSVSVKTVSDSKHDEFNMKAFLNPPEEEKMLSLIIKADSQGSLEAICNSLAKNNSVRIVLKSIGEINKSDIFLAKTSNAIIIGFDVRVPNDVIESAKQEKVIIKTYSIIYELLEELEEVADLLHEKELKEKILKGEAKVMATFTIEGEKIYGIKMTKGKISLNDELEIHRQANSIGKTKLVSLKTRAKLISEIKKDQEAGMIFNPPLDIRIGDMVKSIL